MKSFLLLSKNFQIMKKLVDFLLMLAKILLFCNVSVGIASNCCYFNSPLQFSRLDEGNIFREFSLREVLKRPNEYLLQLYILFLLLLNWFRPYFEYTFFRLEPTFRKSASVNYPYLRGCPILLYRSVNVVTIKGS